MRNMMVVWMLALTLGMAVGCENDKNGSGDTVAGDSQVTEEIDVAAEPDSGGDVTLQTCTDEVDLAGLLPCDCYGTVVTDPAAQVPGCNTRVVCCPAIQGLRCEDYEHVEPSPEIVEDASTDAVTVTDTVAPDSVADTASEEITETVEEATAPALCPNELELSPYVPCTCKGTLVLDVHEAMPTCTKKVVCCPFDGLKCE